jgi:4'-phosphopantetheinyl transferase
VLWQWRTVTPDDADLRGAWRSQLAAHEVRHAETLRLDAVRASYVAARALLRTLIAERGGGEPAGVVLERTPLGAPQLPGLHPAGCSLSHSGNIVIAVLRPHGPVGVDVECVTRRLDDLGALLRVACADVERHTIEALPPGMQQRHFLTAWTGKEAVLKALGLGLSVDPREVVIESGGTAPPSARWLVPDCPASERWSLHRLEDIPDHVATIAVPACEAPHRG